MKFFKLMNRFNREEDGATAIEYGLIAALIAVVIISATTTLGEKVAATFDKVAGELEAAAPDEGEGGE